jgi:Mg/Co/Ni transporter MgtE
MGNILSQNNQINDLYQRLERMEHIDKNNDGIISRKEFEQWKNNELLDIKKSIKNDVKNQYQVKINDLHKELESLKNINNDLSKSLYQKNELIERLGENIDDDEDIQKLVDLLSQEKINQFVEELLEDEETNIKYLPDFVERQIYRNVFQLSIKLMNKMMHSMSFELINHKLHIAMVPNNV